MKVANRDLLLGFIAEHPDAAAAVKTWLAIVEQAEWRNPHDVVRTFNRADLVHGGNRWVFDLRNNRYRLDAKLDYGGQVCLIKRVGTHREYNSWKFDNQKQ
jgi:mRNA interferase HigB